MKRQYFLIPFVFAFFYIQSVAQNPCIKLYTAFDGLPDNDVINIFQDSKKFIWICTYNGLVRYDGYTFTTVGVKDGLSSFRVHMVREDALGRIWFLLGGGGGKYNFLYKNEIFTSINTPILDSLRSFVYTFQDSDSTVYFHNYEKKIYGVDKNNCLRKFQFPTLKCIDYLTKSTDGAFLIWSDGNLYKTRKLSEKPQLIKTTPFPQYFTPLKDPFVFIQIVDPKTRTTFFLKYSREVLVDSIRLPGEFNEFASQVFEDSKGFLWICTINKGVYCIKNKRVYHHFDILNNGPVIEDHEGNIWICGSKGVYKISPCFFSYKYYDLRNFQNQEIISLSPNTEAGVWITAGENRYLLKNNQIYFLDFPTGKRSFNRIFSLKGDNLVITSPRAGAEPSCFWPLKISKIDTLTKRIYCKKIFSRPKRGFGFAINRKEGYFSCIESTGVIKVYSSEQQFKLIDSLDFGKPCDVHYNSKNELVIISDKNYILKNGMKLPYKALNRLSGKDYLAGRVNDSVDYAFDDDDSVFLLCRNKLLNLTAAFDNPIGSRVNMIRIYQSMIYLITNNNIYRCSNPWSIFEKKIPHLECIDISFPTITLATVNNDSIYICTQEGLTIIPLSIFKSVATPSPLLYFKSIMVNDIEAEWPKREINVTGNNKIAFDFRSISYSSTPLIYSYMLEGADTSWTISTSNVLIFQNLARGDYNFKVRVRKLTSPWSRPIECKIRIHATFWQHPLFYFGLVLVSGALLTFFIIRRKNLQIKRRELDHQLILLEQNALQAMMNPHFIFNALGSIQNYLLQNKSGDAGIYLSQFARLIRQNLGSMNTGFISLEEEIDRLKNYMELEKLRLENKFQYAIKVDENVEEDEVMIPSMILQPFVENSIWHGISGIDEQGEIDVSVSMHSPNSVKITVEDNGIGMKSTTESTSKNQQHLNLGAEMTRKRLEILGKKLSIDTSVEYFELKPGSLHPGTRVVLVLPLQEPSGIRH